MRVNVDYCRTKNKDMNNSLDVICNRFLYDLLSLTSDIFKTISNQMACFNYVQFGSKELIHCTNLFRTGIK